MKETFKSLTSFAFKMATRMKLRGNGERKVRKVLKMDVWHWIQYQNPCLWLDSTRFVCFHYFKINPFKTHFLLEFSSANFPFSYAGFFSLSITSRWARARKQKKQPISDHWSSCTCKAWRMAWIVRIRSKSYSDDKFQLSLKFPGFSATVRGKCQGLVDKGLYQSRRLHYLEVRVQFWPFTSRWQ